LEFPHAPRSLRQRYAASRRRSRRVTIPALLGHFLTIAKLEGHDIRVLIFGMGREVAISRCIPVLVEATTNRRDLPRTVLLAPPFRSGQRPVKVG
jgi:hypothetical protein